MLRADGGTRTASITGSAVALAIACHGLVKEGLIESNPVSEMVAAVSVGLVDGVALLDLDYEEDFSAQVDMNVVATASGGLVEVQGTAEGLPFARAQLDELLDLALGGAGFGVVAVGGVWLLGGPELREFARSGARRLRGSFRKRP